MKKMSVFTAVETYLNKYVKYWEKKYNSLPEASYMEGIESFIYVGNADQDGYICWKPIEKTRIHDFSGIEAEVGGQLHSSIKDYFNSLWFLRLEGYSGEIDIYLESVPPARELNGFYIILQGYKEAHDNKLDHIPLGIAQGGDKLVVVDNQTGQVLFEDYDWGSFEVVAESLADFISQMEPQKPTHAE